MHREKEGTHSPKSVGPLAGTMCPYQHHHISQHTPYALNGTCNTLAMKEKGQPYIRPSLKHPHLRTRPLTIREGADRLRGFVVEARK
jgi:hypothetical protein